MLSRIIQERVGGSRVIRFFFIQIDVFRINLDSYEFYVTGIFGHWGPFSLEWSSGHIFAEGNCVQMSEGSIATMILVIPMYIVPFNLIHLPIIQFSAITFKW